MTPTFLVQLTDPHIREPGRLAYGRIDTAPYLRRAVQSVLRLRQRPDAVVVTGDLSDFGRAQSTPTWPSCWHRWPCRST